MNGHFHFSPWVHWNNRHNLKERSSPGVYVLGRFEDELPTISDPTDQRILLVAETHDQSLDARWKQFNYSAFKGGSGHAGGLRFYNLFNNGADGTVPSWLYLSTTIPPADSDPNNSIKELKKLLLSEYEDRHGIVPCCNARNGASEPTVGLQNRGSLSPGPTVTTGPAVINPKRFEPAIAFSPWKRWNERATLEGLKDPGVCMLARFEHNPPDAVDPRDEQIVYIGETCDNDIGVGCGNSTAPLFRRRVGIAEAGHLTVDVPTRDRSSSFPSSPSQASKSPLGRRSFGSPNASCSGTM